MAPMILPRFFEKDIGRFLFSKFSYNKLCRLRKITFLCNRILIFESVPKMSNK